jgi:hypothetical protein
MGRDNTNGNPLPLSFLVCVCRRSVHLSTIQDSEFIITIENNNGWSSSGCAGWRVRRARNKDHHLSLSIVQYVRMYCTYVFTVRTYVLYDVRYAYVSSREFRQSEGVSRVGKTGPTGRRIHQNPSTHVVLVLV